MSESDVLVRCERVGKLFCRDLKKSLWYAVQDLAADLRGAWQTRQPIDRASLVHGDSRSDTTNMRPDEFWAVNDVSFELKRGQCVGLIGRNGAGKTTLLKLLSGLIKPDRGKIELKGTVGALIALGAAFNPILTGRENVYINGSVLGLKKREINNKFEDILAFAEIGDFIDAPVQNYSSGMKVRLGFAVAAMLVQPDVLLLDEVLAVGDLGFTIKCLNRVREIAQSSAVVLVSHKLQHISNFCTHAIVMQDGYAIENTSDVQRALDTYVSVFQEAIASKTFGAGTAELHSVSVRPDVIEQSDDLRHPPATIRLAMNIELAPNSKPCRILIAVKTTSEETILRLPCVDPNGTEVNLTPGLNRLETHLPIGDLNAGCYRIHIVVLECDSQIVAIRIDNAATFRVTSKTIHWGWIVRKAVTEIRSN